MTLAIITSHRQERPRVAEIEIEWIFQNTYSCAREILINGEAWDVDHTKGILLPFWTKCQQLACRIKFQICDGCGQIHHCFQGPEPKSDVLKMLTVPILLPVLTYFPSGLAEMHVVWKFPSSDILATHLLILRSHWYISPWSPAVYRYLPSGEKSDVSQDPFIFRLKSNFFVFYEKMCAYPVSDEFKAKMSFSLLITIFDKFFWSRVPTVYFSNLLAAISYP